MPAISIIIPIYNSSKYLRTCLDSILIQTFQDYEVILVNDGSDDDSGYICEEYEKKDHRFHVFHKENEGVSSARNKGLNEANGDFIVFVDADDYVNTEYIEHLMCSDYDLVITGVKRFNARCDSFAPQSTSSFTINDLPRHWDTIDVINIVYNISVAKRFRSSIIHAHNIRFDEDLFYSEDMLFNMKYMIHSSTCFESPYLDYMYRMENTSRHLKFRMSSPVLALHYERINNGINDLELITGEKSLSGVRDNINQRLINKFYFFLLNCTNAAVFIKNIKHFRKQNYKGYMFSLLSGKKEKRIMKEAVRAPFLTYIVEIRLKAFLRR